MCAHQLNTLFESGTEIYRGYVDDPRNTDNAWTETTACHFHCAAELGEKLRLGAGDDARDVTWLDVDMEEERYSKLYGGHRALVDKAVSLMRDAWTASAWLSGFGVVAEVARTLLGGARPFNELQAVRSLASSTEAALVDRLRAGGIAEALAKIIHPELQRLTEGASTGGELHGKFVQESKLSPMKYGDLSTFFAGLEGKIGAPEPQVRSAMECEHTSSADSDVEFTPTNYLVTTTPRKEWTFTVEPEKCDVWPTEQRAIDSAQKRKPMLLPELRRKLDEVNAQLELLKEVKLMLEEAFGARLYTGPM